LYEVPCGIIVKHPRFPVNFKAECPAVPTVLQDLPVRPYLGGK
jgi:hypothetical protein